MRAIWDFIKGTIISCWAVIAIFTTVCLLSYNDFGVSEFGDYSVIIVDNASLEPIYKKNDIVLVKKGQETDYNVGDTLFFYYGNKETRSYVNLAPVTGVQRIDRVEDKFKFDDLEITYGNIIGNASGSLVYHKLGMVLRLLESRWGFMFLIILPTIYAVCYEVYLIVIKIKEDTKDEIEELEEA